MDIGGCEMKKFQTSFILFILLTLVPFFIPASLNAQSFDLTPIADASTMIPGGSGTFTMFFPPVPIGGDDVVFLAEGASDQEGIYTYIGGTLAVVADTSTSIPGGTGNFMGLGFPVSLGGGNLAFLGFGSSGQKGLYTFIGGTLSLVADLNTMIPGGTGNFTDLNTPVSLGGGDIAFVGQGSSGQGGVFTFISGTLAVVADTSTSIPGGTGNFIGIDTPISLGGGDIAFRGAGSGQEGIYTFIGGTLAVVADFGDMIPGGTGNFTDFPTRPISIGGKNIAFKATGSGQEGVYTFISSALAAVADTGTMIPGGTGNFTGVSDLASLGGGDVVFVGSGLSSQVGIYTSIGGTLAVEADASDMVPGGVGNFTDFEQPLPIGGGDIVFQGINSFLGRADYATISGTVVIVANQSTMIPGGTGTFSGIGFPKPLDSGNISFRSFGSSSQEGLYRTSLRQTKLTIVKETNPNGGTGYSFTGTDFPPECEMDGTFMLDDDGSVACNLDPGSYTVQETNSLGDNIANIDCEGAGDFSTTADSVTINLLEGENAVCTFTNTKPDIEALIVQIAGSGVGNVSAPGINCGNGGMDCQELYPNNTEVTLVATPAAGSMFVGYTGDPDCADGMLTMEFTRNCTATFDLIITSSLTIIKESDPAGATGFEFTGAPFPVGCALRGDFMLDDGGSLSCDLLPGSYIVRETNSLGFTISDIDCEGASDFSTLSDRVTVNLMDNEDVVCTFTNTNIPDAPILNINPAGTGVGNVTAPGIDCGDGGMDCMEAYMLGDEVTLTATPKGGSSFSGFSGDPDCADGMVTMDADVSCTATFDLNTTTYELDISLSGSGDGKVTAPGIDCGDGGADCMESYPDGTEVALIATPKGGSTFSGFTGDSDCDDGMVTVDEDLSCTATFDLIPTNFTLNINLAGTGMGNVSATGIDCGNGGADCMETYASGTPVTLIATPNASSIFTGFTGDSDCTDGMITMNANKTCTATFELMGGAPLILNQIYPGIKNSINFMTASNSTPGGRVGFVWGFKTGSLIIGAPCPGLELGINPIQVLGYVNADAGGVANLKFFVPSLGNTVWAYTQAVDISACRKSGVVQNILRNN
jgi:hypothetical protein